MYQKIHSINGAFWLKEKKDSQNRLHGKSSGCKSFYGHKVESQAGSFDILVIAGRFTIEEMAATVCFKTDVKSIKRVRQHLFAKLRDILGIDIKTDSKGRVFAACNKESAANNKSVNAAEQAKLEQDKLASVRHIKAKAQQAKIDQKIAKQG